MPVYNEAHRLSLSVDALVAFVASRGASGELLFVDDGSTDDTAHLLDVVEPDGSIADFWPIEGKGLCTNCCFGGPDLRTLFVADALPGGVVAFEGTPTPGLPLPSWPGPT